MGCINEKNIKQSRKLSEQKLENNIQYEKDRMGQIQSFPQYNYKVSQILLEGYEETEDEKGYLEIQINGKVQSKGNKLNFLTQDYRYKEEAQVKGEIQVNKEKKYPQVEELYFEKKEQNLHSEETEKQNPLLQKNKDGFDLTKTQFIGTSFLQQYEDEGNQNEYQKSKQYICGLSVIDEKSQEYLHTSLFKSEKAKLSEIKNSIGQEQKKERREIEEENVKDEIQISKSMCSIRSESQLRYSLELKIHLQNLKVEIKNK